MNTINNAPTFTGIYGKFDNVKQLEKINNFVNDSRNMDFINKLEKDFNIDTFISSKQPDEMPEIAFIKNESSNKIDLTSHGMDVVDLNHFANNQENILTSLKKALAKYKISLGKQQQKINRRGC